MGMNSNSIRLSLYGGPGIACGGVKTEINGVEMQDVAGINIYCPVGEYPRLTLTQFGRKDLDVELVGEVHPRVIMTDPDYELVVEYLSGKTRYRMVKR